MGDIDSNVPLFFLVNFGFAYLMFLSGLEVDFSILAQGGNRPGARLGGWFGTPSAMGGIHFVVAFALALGFGWIFAEMGLTRDAFLTALILGTTSVGIVMPTLKERGLLEQFQGQTALIAALAADFVTVFLVTFLAASHVGGSAPNFAFTALLIVAFLVVLRAGATFSRLRVVRRTLDELSMATSQLKVRGSLALMVAFLALSQALGAEIILGAFLAGAVISFLSRQEGTALRTSLDAIGYGFFIPIFFIAVGARFELSALLGSGEGLALVPFLLVAAVLVKVVPSIVFVRMGLSMRQSLATGFLLTSRLSLIIAVAEVGLELGLLSNATNSAIVLVAIITSLLGPAAFNWLMGANAEQDAGIFVIGDGDVVELLSQRLRAQRVTVMNPDELGGSPGQAKPALSREQLQKFSTFVAATDEDSFNLQICLEAKILNPSLQFVALVQDHSRVTGFHRAGIKVVDQSTLLAKELDEHIHHPSIFALLDGEWGEKEIVETIVRNPQATGTPLRRMLLPGDVQILLVHRHERSFVPRAQTVLEGGDWVILAGERVATETAADFLAAVRGTDTTVRGSAGVAEQ